MSAAPHALAKSIRVVGEVVLPEIARALESRYWGGEEDDENRRALRHAEELVLVLARLLEGRDVYAAFGAPGDWGYETAVGARLCDYYSTSAWTSKLVSRAELVRLVVGQQWQHAVLYWCGVWEPEDTRPAVDVVAEMLGGEP